MTNIRSLRVKSTFIYASFFFKGNTFGIASTENVNGTYDFQNPEERLTDIFRFRSLTPSHLIWRWVKVNVPIQCFNFITNIFYYLRSRHLRIELNVSNIQIIFHHVFFLFSQREPILRFCQEMKAAPEGWAPRMSSGAPPGFGGYYLVGVWGRFSIFLVFVWLTYKDLSNFNDYNKRKEWVIHFTGRY